MTSSCRCPIVKRICHMEFALYKLIIIIIIMEGREEGRKGGNKNLVEGENAGMRAWNNFIFSIVTL